MLCPTKKSTKNKSQNKNSNDTQKNNVEQDVGRVQMYKQGNSQRDTIDNRI